MSVFQTVLNFKKLEAKRSGKKFKIPKPPIQPDKRPLQLDYYRDLKSLISRMSESIDLYILPQLEGYIRDYEASRPKLDSYRADAFYDDAEEDFDDSKLFFYGVWTDQAIEAIALQNAIKINARNISYYSKVYNKVLGVRFTEFEPWREESLQLFVRQNVKLIKNVSEQFYATAEEVVLRGVREGRLVKDITKDLKDKLNISQNRAKLIARDQTSKYYEDLNRTRQIQAGITKYIWRIADFERSRPSHRSKNDNIYNWDDPPSDTGHPGNDVNCRCSSEPVIE